MSFNVLYDYGVGERYSWQSRREYVFSLIQFHAPDVFCLQEPLQNQVEDFAAYFSDYSYLTAGCGDGISKGQHMTIFFLTGKFDLLEYGKFGLSETPNELGVVGWDAKNPRLALWAKLLQKDTDSIFYVINTHLDHKGENARQQSALLLGKKINEIAGDIPCLLCGDFNANERSKAYSNVIECGFIDCAGIPSAINYKQPYSYHKFLLGGDVGALEEYKDDPRVLKVIDHIFYKGRVKVLSHAVLGDNFAGIYPSDHFPKLCDVVIAL
jgi:endonuclease/exonuclease/phosphatase family metal-dependent hydrolase